MLWASLSTVPRQRRELDLRSRYVLGYLASLCVTAAKADKADSCLSSRLLVSFDRPFFRCTLSLSRSLGLGMPRSAAADVDFF